jgi:hypothetical protein
MAASMSSMMGHGPSSKRTGGESLSGACSADNACSIRLIISLFVKSGGVIALVF